MISLTRNRMVVCPGGRVGMTCGNSKAGQQTYVKFGANGPILSYARRRLRYATEEEVNGAGYAGVGRDATMERRT